MVTQTKPTCAHPPCGTPLNRYTVRSGSKYCGAHAFYDLSEKPKKPQKQRICTECKITVLQTKRKSNICIGCESIQHEAERAAAKLANRNFRTHIQKTYVDPIENPTPKDIIEVVADAYCLSPRQLMSSDRSRKTIWVRSLAIYFVCEKFPIRRATPIPGFPNINRKQAQDAINRIQGAIEDEKISNTVNQIRTRFRLN